MRKLTTEEFIARGNETHGEGRYDYSETVYTGAGNKVIIKCNECLHRFKQRPNCHTKMKKGCPKCSNTKKRSKACIDFIQKAKSISGDRYVYDRVEYINNYSKVWIGCRKHGYWEQVPRGHLSGHNCPKCRLFSKGDFIERARKNHGDKYCYDLVDFKGHRVPVTIICTEPGHGAFSQLPECHIKSVIGGCRKCSPKRKRRCPYSNFSWTVTSWIEAAKASDNFDSFKVYFVRLFNDFENFFKVGITYNHIERRMKSIPYSYETISYIEGEAREVFNLETTIKRTIKNFSYKPQIEFGGQYECFAKTDESTEVVGSFF